MNRLWNRKQWSGRFYIFSTFCCCWKYVSFLCPLGNTVFKKQWTLRNECNLSSLSLSSTQSSFLSSFRSSSNVLFLVLSLLILQLTGFLPCSYFSHSFPSHSPYISKHTLLSFSPLFSLLLHLIFIYNYSPPLLDRHEDFFPAFHAFPTVLSLVVVLVLFLFVVIPINISFYSCCSYSSCCSCSYYSFCCFCSLCSCCPCSCSSDVFFLIFYSYCMLLSSSPLCPLADFSISSSPCSFLLFFCVVLVSVLVYFSFFT